MHKIFLLILILTTILMNSIHAQIKDIDWEIWLNLPEFRKGGCFGIIGKKLVSVFGMRFPWGEMASMYVFNPEENLWTRGPDGPMRQCYVEGIECNGKFYSIGGRQGTCHNRCFWLSEKKDQYIWSALPQLNDRREWVPSFVIDNCLYVLGGSAGNFGPTLKSVEALIQ